MIKHIASVIGMTSLALTLNTAMASEPLRIGVDIFPPFSEMAPDGSLKGFDIDIAKALCEEMKRECTWVQQDWDGIIPALQARKFDAIVASMSITPERSRKVDFTDKYYQSPARFVASAGVDWEDSNDGLRDKIVGVQRGTTQHNYMMAKYPDVRLKLYSSPEDANIDLSAGRVDAVFADSLVMAESFLNTSLGQGFAFLGGEHSDPNIFGKGEGIAIRKNQPELKAEFNKAIKAIRKNGVYQEINARYFDFDIYGG
ncbi:MAG: transporter substrate-binding domain-containing protein [Oceanospirillales bacterium]|nr:transporter substrate-binding domain-containing protein [Oceanospirillales bacterium]